MMKYGGEVVFRTDGPHGLLEIVDEQLIRSLHFGDPTRQSSMLHAHPAVLVLPYTQYMLATLLFDPQPRRVLLLGLGGASLPRFFAHRFPAVIMDVVELRDDVIVAARRFFGLPDSPRITVHHDDCARFLADAEAGYGDYDLVLMDIYDDRGIVPLVEDRTFLGHLVGRMSAHGILAGNLSQLQRPLLRGSLRAIRETFGGDVLRLPVRDKGNEIVIATTRATLDPTAPEAARRAAGLKEQLGLDFPAFLGAMEPYRIPLLDRIKGRPRRGNRRRGSK
ncbi:MAG: spermidine synthase [Gammaproteobacteria bacterium]|nr:spermidine synthase [Gammaproteobacteria bacterium]